MADETPTPQQAPAPQTQTPRSEAPGTPDPPATTQTPPAPPQPAPAPAASRELPAEDQAPVASERDKAIVGDSGLFNQQPTGSIGDPDTPVRSSAPPAQMQSGIPVPEPEADSSQEQKQG